MMLMGQLQALTQVTYKAVPFAKGTEMGAGRLVRRGEQHLQGRPLREGD